MRLVTRHPTVEELQTPPERLVALRAWLEIEVEDAFASRKTAEREGRENLRMYASVPKKPVRTSVEIEVEDAFPAGKTAEGEWSKSLRMYEGVPKNPVRNVPVENAPNV